MAVSRQVEVERKYAVPEGAAMPSFAGLPGVASAEPAPAARLEAVYLDTADRTLLRARIALRRRTGGHDAGWHVKLPAAAGRTELHAPIDPEDPEALPAGLARALRTRVRGERLEPIARIVTERAATVVTGTGGGRVEVVDDLVRATDVAAGVVRSWREWEAERIGDDPAGDRLLDDVDAVLRGAGAAPSASPAKLAQALGGPPPPTRPPATAGEVLAAAVAEEAERLHRGVLALALDGDPDGSVVHGVRKALRDLRSLLAVERVAGPAGERLRAGLGALAAPLGEARDALVASRTGARLLEAVPAGTPGRDAARTVLVDAPAAEVGPRTAAALDVLLGDGAAGTWAALDGFAADGPRAGDGPDRLGREARRQLRRAARRARRAGDDLAALHRARKAAKRARVVARLAGGLDVAGARRLRRRAKADRRAQDALGDHRDLALVLEGLPAASIRLGADGGNAYALGIAAAEGRRRLRRLRDRAGRRLRALR